MAITDAEVIQRARTLIQDDAYGVHPAPRRYSDDQMQGFLRQTLSYMVQLRPDIFTVTCNFEFSKTYDGYGVGTATAEQRLPPPAVRLVELLYSPGVFSWSDNPEAIPVLSSAVFEEVDWDAYVRAAPSWVLGTRGYSRSAYTGRWLPLVSARYVRHPRNPVSFFIWPATELHNTYLDVVVSPHPLAAFDAANPQKIYVAKCKDFPSNLNLGGPDVFERPENEIDEYYLLPDAYLGALVDGVVYLAESIDNEHANSGRAKLFYESFCNQLGIDFTNREATDVSDAGVRAQKPGPAVGGTQ